MRTPQDQVERRVRPRSGRSERRLLAVGCFAFAVLPNADLLNYLLNDTFVVVWKQLLALIMALLAIPVFSRLGSAGPEGAARVRRLIGALATALVALTASSLLQGLSVIRVAYALLAYAGFASALLFVHSALHVGRLPTVLRLLVILGAVSGVGLLVDFFFPVFSFLPRAANVSLEDALAGNFLHRAAFLFGASTTVFPFMGLTIVASFIILSRRELRSIRLVAFANLFLAPAGIAATGSRAQLTLCSILIAALFLGKLLYERRAAFVAVAGGVLLIGVYSVVTSLSRFAQGDLLTSRYLDQFDERAAGNDTRYMSWRAGAEVMFAPPGYETVLGIGLGRSMGMVNDGERATPHYESSLFQAFSEGGVLGVGVRYGPALIALWFSLGAVLRRSYVGYLLFTWMSLYSVAVSVAPTAAAYHTQMAYFTVVALALAIRRVEAALGVEAPARWIASARRAAVGSTIA